MIETAQSMNRVLIQHLNNLLEKISPEEAGFAESYVMQQEEYDSPSSREKLFGIPGGDLATLLGPIVLPFVVSIAWELLGAAKKKGAELAVSKTMEFLTSKLRKKSNSASIGKEETIKSITSALIDAGWKEEKAKTAANLIWECGIQVSEELPK